MLKYRINQKNIQNDEDQLFIKQTVVSNVVLSEDEIADHTQTSMAKFYCEDLCKLQQDSSLIVKHSIPKYTLNGKGSVYTDYNLTYQVRGINFEKRTFTVRFNKFAFLPLLEVRKEVAGGIDYMYLYFQENTFFNNNGIYELTQEGDDEAVSDYEEDIEDEGEAADPPVYATIWLDYFNIHGERVFESIQTEVIDERRLRIVWNDIENNDNLNTVIDAIFEVNADGSTDYGTGNTYAVRVYRENIQFSLEDAFEVYYINPKLSIPVGLVSNSHVDIHKETLVEEYVANAKENAINKGLDGEKLIVYPMIVHRTDDNFDNVVKINFNFHFRTRSEENWISNDEDYWNGVQNNNGILSFENNFWQNKNRWEEQSDLLDYLGFTNSDVKFQKNKLKKSFIRLSFYDSINPANQNLLGYSSIFMNGGDYFQKYIKHLSTKGYIKTIEQNTSILKGISVDREFKYNSPATSSEKSSIAELEEIEGYRLSSQISVTNRHKTTASSEGFYLYLWKDILDSIDDKGLQVCMKVEFNHAGYGRVIPFMMPFWDEKKHGRTGIKTFQEILNDFNGVADTDGKYGMKQFIKFSYVYLRIKWDENSKKYIYCLDDTVYGKDKVDTTVFTNNTLNINLYEAKISL